MKRLLPEALPASVVAYEITPGRVLFVHDLPALSQLHDLGDAEREVCELVLHGLDNRSIAAKRRTSASTVANQITSIFRKLGVRSRAELVAKLLDVR